AKIAVFGQILLIDVSTDQLLRRPPPLDPVFQSAQVIDRISPIAAGAMVHPWHHKEPEKILRGNPTTHGSLHRLIVINATTGEYRKVIGAVGYHQLATRCLELAQIGVVMDEKSSHSQPLVIMVEIEIRELPAGTRRGCKQYVLEKSGCPTVNDPVTPLKL